MKDNYDCVVVGGGPAAATTAALVAAAGRATLLAEPSEALPIACPEPLLPETYGVLRRLGAFGAAGEDAPLAPAVALRTGGQERRPPRFRFADEDLHDDPVPGIVGPHDFRRALREIAAGHGADCALRTRVLDVLRDGARVVGVALQAGDEPPRRVACRMLVDAAGQSSRLPERLGLAASTEESRQAAIWGYYRGARRDPGEAHRAAALLETCGGQSQFWHLPLPQGVASIGVVGDDAYLLAGRGRPADVFEDELVNCPALIERLLDAELVSKFHVARAVGANAPRCAGAGWVLLGDASQRAAPPSPLGVFLAMLHGEFVADAILAGLARNDVSARSFAV